MLLIVTSLACVMTCTSAGSSKKGLAESHYNLHCNDLDVMTNIAWWYDWKQSPYHALEGGNCSSHVTSTNHVPMVWGWRQHKDLPLWFTNHTSRYVLGFNEPNHLGQSNLTPLQAAAAWRTIQQRADQNNQLLVSPSATKCTGGPEKCISPGVQWFEEFFKACHGCRVDFLATHSYSCDVSHVMDWLDELYSRFHKKIWLTEVACGADSHSHVLSYMKELLPKLENSPHVYRYSWFSSRVRGTGTASQADSLFHTNTASLNTLGNYYQHFM